jgi:hypothetical protein
MIMKWGSRTYSLRVMIIVFLTLLLLLLSVTCAIAALSSFVLLSCVAELVMIK